jgi:hypothetical protein
MATEKKKAAPKAKAKPEEISAPVQAEIINELPQVLYHPGLLMDEGRKALLANDLPAILAVLDKINKMMRVHGAAQTFGALQELQLLLMNKQNALQNK